ncbi:hypothetical protein Q3G72_018125 [Acer saccharum]|nr:hypothetical protein Q3G72_018125 [Acer saccharum]
MAVAVSSPAFMSGDDFPADYGEWFPKDSRRAGVLLHPTSFPGPYSIGEEAFRFIDWLLDSGWSLWLFGRSILWFIIKPKDLLKLIKPEIDHSPKPTTIVAAKLEAFITKKKIIGMVVSISKTPTLLHSNLYKQSKDEVAAGRILDKYIDFEAVTFKAIFDNESFKEYFEKMEGLKT